jgi:hypothetical protein
MGEEKILLGLLQDIVVRWAGGGVVGEEKKGECLAGKREKVAGTEGKF